MLLEHSFYLERGIFKLGEVYRIEEKEFVQKTPIHWACDEGHTEVAMALVERGADIHVIE